MERALEGLPAAPGKRLRPRPHPGPHGRGRSQADRPQPTPGGGRRGAPGASTAPPPRSTAIAADLRRMGREQEAEIVETGALIAQDPALQREVLAAVVERGAPAAAAILDATEAQAQLVAAIDDARLAERADDIRSIGRRAAGLVGLHRQPQRARAANGSGEVLIATDLGPAEVAELDRGSPGSRSRPAASRPTRRSWPARSGSRWSSGWATSC